MLVLGFDFRKQGEGKKITIYYSMHDLVALDSKQLCHEDASAVAVSGDLILERRHAELWLVTLFLTLGLG